MRIGNYELSAVETGRFALDGGAMFGVVPRTLWERGNPPDGRHRVALSLRSMLIRELDAAGKTTGRNVIVDTGVGAKWNPREVEIYAIDLDGSSLESSLKQLQLDPTSITDVLLTHLHFDHAGGATSRTASGQLVPTFPNATYHVQARNLDWARNPTDKDRASYRPDDYEPLIDAGVLETLDGPGEFLPGIDLIVSEGHTTAMQLPRVHGDGGCMVYCADLIPTSSHVAVPWVMAYDNHPLTTIEEKSRLLRQACDEGWWLFFEHDPIIGAARIEEGPKGFSPTDTSGLGA